MDTDAAISQTADNAFAAAQVDPNSANMAANASADANASQSHWDDISFNNDPGDMPEAPGQNETDKPKNTLGSDLLKEPALKGATAEADKTPDNKPALKDATAEADKAKAPEAESDNKDAKADQENLPITEWERFKETLSNPDIDQTTLDAFGRDCALKLGLSPKQARGLIDWQLDIIKKAQEANDQAYEKMLIAEQKAIIDAWGDAKDANAKLVDLAVGRIEQVSPGFTEAMRKLGAHNSSAILGGLLAVGKLLDEDAVGFGGGAATDEEDDEYYFLNRAFPNLQS